MRHGTHIWHTYACIMAHIRMSHGTHTCVVVNARFALEVLFRVREVKSVGGEVDAVGLLE